MQTLKSLLTGLILLFVAAETGSAQTISIVSGQGQLSCAFFCIGGFEPLVVVVKNANAVPLPNTTVKWSVSAPGMISGGLQTTTTTTDANGQSSVLFSQQGTSSSGFQYLQSAVTATVGASTATFYETTALTNSNGALLVNPQLIQPAIGETLVARTGETLPAAVQANLGAPNVALQIVAADSATPASVTCAASTGQPAGVVLSDSSGIATCSLVFGPTPGTSPFNIAVGKNFKIFGPFTATTIPAYVAHVQQPINPDGSSVFSARRGVLPVKFRLSYDGFPTCTLPPATISIIPLSVAASNHPSLSKPGPQFNIDAPGCQYLFRLDADSLGAGTYKVEISLQLSTAKLPVGSAIFRLR